MAEFDITDKGEGRFYLSGKMTFQTAGDVLRDSERMLEGHTQIEMDLGGVTETDSAGLALMLEWITWANHTVREIRFLNVPEMIDAIAKTTEVDHLLRRGERWAGFIEAPND
jgi:phospholipid transport system transporter-binding protein